MCLSYCLPLPGKLSNILHPRLLVMKVEMERTVYPIPDNHMVLGPRERPVVSKNLIE
jgi:hypothetical protein